MEIVGLKQIVPDNVNSIILKFVGINKSPIAKLIEPYMETFHD